MTTDQLVDARMRTLSMLSGATVHELRGAPNSLALHLHLLTVEPDSDAARERHRRSLALADEGRRRLFDLAEMFVRHAAIRDAREESFDLTRLVADAVALLGPYAAHRRVDLTVAADAGIPPVLGRREVVFQVLLDLLVQLLDRNEHGLTLEVTAGPTDGRVCVSLRAPATPDADVIDRSASAMRSAGGTARRSDDGSLVLELPAAPLTE